LEGKLTQSANGDIDSAIELLEGGTKNNQVQHKNDEANKKMPTEDETDPFKVVKDQIAEEKDYPDGGMFEAKFLQKKKQKKEKID